MKTIDIKFKETLKGFNINNPERSPGYNQPKENTTLKGLNKNNSYEPNRKTIPHLLSHQRY